MSTGGFRQVAVLTGLALATLGIGWRVSHTTRATAAAREPVSGARGYGSVQDEALIPAGSARVSEPARVEASLPSTEGTSGAAVSAAVPAAPAPGVTPATPGPEFSVRVIDWSGRPVVGVPVVLLEEDVQAADAGSHSARDVVRARRTEIGRTGEDGCVATPASRIEEIGVRSELPNFVLTCLVPLAQAPRLELGPRVASVGAYTLLLPPAGALRVRVTRANGEPASRAFVEASLRKESWAERVEAPVLEGVALFPAVELDAEIELRLTTPDLRAKVDRLLVSGPTLAGEVVEAALDLAEWPTLRLRVQDEAGTALVGTPLRMRILHGRLSPQDAAAASDTEGGVDLIVLGQPRSEDRRELLLWTLSPPRLARHELPPELAWPTELGVITLRAVASNQVPPTDGK